MIAVGRLRRVEQDLFRDVIGHFPSGVTVVTTRTGEKNFGTTASAMTSLSIEPPMLLVCLNRTSETQAAIRVAGGFAVNILAEHQADIARQFAVKASSKFEQAQTIQGASGMPLLRGALAQLECRVTETVTGGTHTVFLAEVDHATAGEGSPLAYYRGEFGRFEAEQRDAAYRHLRSMVLGRELPLDTPLDQGQLADALGLERARIHHALTRLVSDGLVAHDPERGYVIEPLDIGTIDQILGARALIEMAVCDDVLPAIAKTDIDLLQRHADAACLSIKHDTPDLRRLSDESRAFHDAFVGLAHNDTIATVHRRLAVEALWQRIFAVRPTPGYIAPGYLHDLVAACRARSADAGRTVVVAHAAKARAIAREVLRGAGGTI
jgi:flavin reductase (DIM6/NTAB) family NADH-FMN oxidoreductase RutF/DNA-binding GntR family transcriptional regulator